MAATPSNRYTGVAILLHWLVAAFLMIAVFVGLLATQADESEVRRLVDMHKSFGLTLLALVTLRLLWRIAHPPPPLPARYPKRERVTAHAVHLTLYVVMLALPLTGYIHDSAWKLASTHPIILYGLVPFPRIGWIEALDPAIRDRVHDIFSAGHLYAGYALYALVALHLLGVAKHHMIDRENELQRMLPAPYRADDPQA